MSVFQLAHLEYKQMRFFDDFSSCDIPNIEKESPFPSFAVYEEKEEEEEEEKVPRLVSDDL